MADSTMGGGGLQPSGETLRRAMRWLDDRAQDDPRLDRARAVGEAAVRFDLTPLEEDFLLREWASRR
ncbi:hypothetical protein [Anaeromyxobacter oryzae]|uniref:Uncharacterized protein n=1 Tax=Anaeromyxobacter oryzae TaxID=2918170 RepID=A0ABN6MUF6_9BACT|nr:hypothetical protein [Anaeromyxobacter oryzae]BDG04571.1 hypothetical protein AMOR_35670 [Anaeromyxobacter oryzae]